MSLIIVTYTMKIYIRNLYLRWIKQYDLHSLIAKKVHYFAQLSKKVFIFATTYYAESVSLFSQMECRKF